MTVVGLLHPGEMGAAIGSVLRGRGETVLWASAGRSTATAERARLAGLEDVGEEEIARSMRARDLPPGFQEAAGEIFRRATP